MNCPSKDHYENLLIWGKCHHCQREFALNEVEESRQEALDAKEDNLPIEDLEEIEEHGN